MKRYLLLFFLLFSNNEIIALEKQNIIKNLENTKNLSFDFEQNIDGEKEKGKCILEFPKKIFCKYNSENKKTLISNGRYIVIKTINSYYIYNIKRTPLNLILNKNFIIDKIKNTKGRIIDNKFVNFQFSEADFQVNIFFDYKTLNLIGWQTTDIYQNLNITFLASVKKNQELNNNLFILPKQN